MKAAIGPVRHSGYRVNRTGIPYHSQRPHADDPVCSWTHCLSVAATGKTVAGCECRKSIFSTAPVGLAFWGGDELFTVRHLSPDAL